jgi:hypothetical protein
MAGLDGDAEAYHTLLERLTGHLRAYFRQRPRNSSAIMPRL